jgi:hypothetical protein
MDLGKNGGTGCAVHLSHAVASLLNAIISLISGFTKFNQPSSLAARVVCKHILRLQLQSQSKCFNRGSALPVRMFQLWPKFNVNSSNIFPACKCSNFANCSNRGSTFILSVPTAGGSSSMLNVPTRAQSLSIFPTGCQNSLSHCPTLGPKPLSILPTGGQACMSTVPAGVPRSLSNFPTECRASLSTVSTSD